MSPNQSAIVATNTNNVATTQKTNSRDKRGTKEPRLSLHFGGYSHQGLKAENQDAFAAFAPKGSEINTKGAVAALADGVSSASKAAQASQLSVTQFIEEYYATTDTWSTKKSAAKVLTSLNQWLFSQSDNTNSLSGYCEKQQWLTTFSALIFKSTTGYIFHVGDTRIYQYKNNQLECVTTDHNSKQNGQHTVLTRALGADSRLQVDYHSVDIGKGEIFLLTCDGVHDFMSSDDIKRQLALLPKSPQSKDLEQTSKILTDIAIKNGSDDNVSALLVYVSQTPHQTLDEIERDILSKVIPPALKVGMKLDGYKVLKNIHASIRSHLYLVEDEETHEKLVLKVPSLNFSDDTVYLQGFMREAWIGERIDHHNIMKIKTGNSNSRFLYHLCEYIEGQTLTDWIQDNPRPSIAKVRSIINQLIAALRTFQRLEVVHRDLKPDNVMIDSYGQLKLIDYGTVHVASLAEDCNVINETVPQGSLNYIAPESMLYMKSTNMSDLFSLGTICYQMLTGELPYKPMTRAVVTQKSYDDWQYRSIKQFRPDLPFWLDLCLQQSTHPDPKHRYKAFSEFATDLTQPNLSAIEHYQKQPLLQRNPVLFWQSISSILLILLITSIIL